MVKFDIIGGKYMSYDWFSIVDSIDDNNFSQNKIAKRQKLAATVHKPDVDKTNKNDAKTNAGKLTVESFDNILPYHSPWDIEPPFSRSVAVLIKWKLATPFHSRSESFFEPIDNPLVRDKLTNRALLRSTGIKGMLRAIIEANQHDIAEMLMGAKSDNQENANAARIIMGDVLFDAKYIMDVFSPHHRQKRVANLPISFEVVPENTNAEFGFYLYELNKNEIDFKQYLKIIFESMRDLLTLYGMSAKRTADYGLAKPDKIEIFVKPGKAINIPEDSKFIKKEKPDFLEPQPPMPEGFNPGNIDEEKKSLLLADGSLCKKEEAWERVFNYRLNKEEKEKGKVKGNRKEKLKTKSQNDGPKHWDELNAEFSKMENIDKEEIKKQQEAYNEWLKRKEEFEEKHSKITWEFHSFEDAINEMERVVTQ